MGMTRLAITATLLAMLVACNGNVMEEPPLLPLPEKAEYMEGYFKNSATVDYTALATCNLDESLSGTLGEEGYLLEVSKKGIRITAAAPAGIFYAKQTVRQLTTPDGVRLAKIKDKPRFPYRGFHLDVSRNFFPKEEIMKLLDEMAYFKMNKFHFHLTDNGGWRLQIRKYPLLTELGSSRKILDWFDWYLNDRHFCPENTEGAFGGYYTQDDIREIVAYASARFIDVIPEIDVPAHSDPVFAGYPQLNCTGTTSGNGEYCPALEETYDFIEGVLDEVMEMFPSKVIHIGGDEARKVEWKKCPRCKALMEKEGFTDYDQLQVYLIRRVHDYLKEHGRIMAGWDELMKDEELEDALIYSYRGEKHGIDAANRQIPTIMVPGEALYLDWWQADIDQEPEAMGGYSPLHKFYNFNPLPCSKEETRQNERLIRPGRDVDADSVGFIRKGNERYLKGVQGCLWTEFVETAEHLEYMAFPRLLAIAEKGWSQPDRTDGWTGFTRRIGIQNAALQARGIHSYDLHDAPLITASAEADGSSLVSMICEQYDGEIRYCTGKDETLSNGSARYTAPFRITEDQDFTAGVFKDGKLVSYVRKTKVAAGLDKHPDYPQKWPW